MLRIVRWECIEAAAGEEGRRGREKLGDDCGGSAGGGGGGGGGAKTGLMVSSSSFASSLASDWLALDETSLSFCEMRSGCSLPSSLVVSSVVELRRGLSRIAEAGARAADAALTPFRDGGAFAPVEVGASDDLEFLCAVVVAAAGTPEVLRAAVVEGACRLGLDRVADGARGFLVAGGVLVRDVDALETPLVPSCLVGDLMGDRMPLSEGRAAGAGLPEAPTILCRLTPLTPDAAGGRGLAATPLPTVFVALGLTTSTT